jgi:hypothetical protein
LASLLLMLSVAHRPSWVAKCLVYV